MFVKFENKNKNSLKISFYFQSSNTVHSTSTNRTTAGSSSKLDLLSINQFISHSLFVYTKINQSLSLFFLLLRVCVCFHLDAIYLIYRTLIHDIHIFFILDHFHSFFFALFLVFLTVHSRVSGSSMLQNKQTNRDTCLLLSLCKEKQKTNRIQ